MAAIAKTDSDISMRRSWLRPRDVVGFVEHRADYKAPVAAAPRAPLLQKPASTASIQMPVVSLRS